MTEVDRLKLWARPEDVLTAQERTSGLMQQYLRLFAEQLTRLAREPTEPMMTEIIAARAASGALWNLDRNLRSGNFYQQYIEKEPSRVQARQNMFSELDLNYRISAACSANLKFADDLLKMARLEPGVALELVKGEVA